MSKNLRFIPLSAFLFFMFPVLLFSQQPGEVTGNIIDGENGSAMRSATVRLVDTKLGAVSDVKGEFRIKKVPAGVYTAKITFMGYQERLVENVRVEQGKAVNIGGIVLAVENKMSKELVVEGRRVKDNEAAILAQRKNSAQVSDGMSQQEISRLPDSDAGQSLKRVSGVTLVDNKFVFVRGTSERYSNTTLNGASLSSTEPDKKAFSFDLFPAEFLQNVNIAKSFTPDLPGNFAGGLVQLNTVDFPSESSFKFSYSNAYNNNVTMADNKFVSTSGGSTDWLGIDDGTRALPAAMPSTRRDFDALRKAALDPADQTGAKEKYQSLIQSFNAKSLKQNNETIDPMANSNLALNFSNVGTLMDNQYGIIGSVNYGNSYSINDVQRGAVMFDGSPMFGATGKQASKSVSWGGLLNVAYKIGTSTSFSLRNVYNHTADDDAVQMHGQDSAYQFIDYKNFSTQYVEKELYSLQFGGDHNFEESNNLLEWNFGYSHSNRYEPDFRKMRFDRPLAEVEFDPAYPYTAQLTSTEQGDGQRLGRFYSDMNDNSFSGKIDFTIPVNSDFKLKVGALGENKDRDFGARSFTIIAPPSGSSLDPEIEAQLTDYQNPDKIFAQENFRVDDGFRIGEETKMSDSYTAGEKVYAGYVMMDAGFALAEESFRFIGGLRYEDATQSLQSFDISDRPVDVNSHFGDFLPSLNLVWKSSDISNVRASATQTLARPSLREFAPFGFYDFMNQILVIGNPNLKRSLIQNYDIRYEIFPYAGEVISVSGFYKRFENAIEETIFPQQSELTKSYANAEGIAFNYGVEFEVRKGLGFLTSFLEDISFNMNLAFIKSEITVLQGGAGTEDTRPMWGQSPYTLNLGLFYVHPEYKTAVNIAYNTYGKRIVQVAQRGMYAFEDPHVYELPRDLVDISVSHPILENLEAKLTVRDLLNQKLQWVQGERTYQDGSKSPVVVASNLRGTTIGISFGYRF